MTVAELRYLETVPTRLKEISDNSEAIAGELKKLNKNLSNIINLLTIQRNGNTNQDWRNDQAG